jgi:hypothetical protein
MSAQVVTIPTAHQPLIDVVAADAWDGNSSGVSWGAIFAGAAAACSLSLVLVILGFGLGLSAVSPWTNTAANLSASAETIGVSTIIWIAFTQIAASGLGGYLAGRLRVKWARVHSDEVYFRDTAHGFMAWAVASLVTAAFLTSAVTAAIGSGVQASATVASGVAAGAGAAAPTMQHGAPTPSIDASANYFVDALFRTDSTAPATTDAAASAASHREALAIFTNNLRAGDLTAEDKTYLGQIVAKQTGLNQADAEKRVADRYTQLRTSMSNAANEGRQMADKARKAAAYSSLWMFIALMCGAFFASLAATYGGKRRDHIV